MANGILEKPCGDTVIIEKMKSMMDSVREKILEEYLPIRLDTLFLAKQAVTEIFIKLSDNGHYVCVFHKGARLEEHEKQKFKKKNINSLYLKKEDLKEFLNHYIIRLGILDGKIGFVISVIQMQYTFNKYMFLMYKNKN